jgi:DNA-binding IclR family transcriptional regulator
LVAEAAYIHYPEAEIFKKEVQMDSVRGQAGKAPASKSEKRPRSMVPAAANDRQFVTALARGLQILGCFSTARPELNGSEIARLTGLPQPSVWRLCHTLLELGMLVQTSGDNMRPGLPVLRLGYSAIAGLDILDLARPHMQEIATEFDAACGLAKPDGLDMVFVQRCEGNNQLLMSLRVGSTISMAKSALGWAHLVGLPGVEREKVIAYLQKNDSDNWNSVKKKFAKALSEYESFGYVLNAGTFHKAYNAIAIPVIAEDGSVPYALNCGSATVTMSVSTLRTDVAPRLVALGRLLGLSLPKS